MGDSMSTIINATTTNGVVIQPDNSGSLVLQTNSGTTALTIDTSQRAAFVAGTAALPAITTTGDTNTGIFFSAADTIDFAEGGTAVGQFDSSANFKFNSGYGSVETAYGCRAWVNFNGSGTVAIRASGNVTSITDNGNGDYTINFTTAMPDVNYSAVGSAGNTGTSADAQFWVWQKDTGNRTTTAVRLVSTQHGTAGGWGPNPGDVSQFNVVVFR
jgi:hypothetical protein